MTAEVMRRLNSNSAFARRLKAAALPEIERQLHAVGADAVRRADLNVEARYDNSRTGFRSKGETKLLGSFDYRVEPSREGVARLVLTSSADPAKVNSLEYGSKAHTITATDAAMLVFDANPRTVMGQRLQKSLGPAKNIRQRRRRTTMPTTGALTTVESVKHLGTREGRFMRDALESAIRAAYRVALRL